MRCAARLAPLMACLSFALAAPVLAASPAAVAATPPAATKTDATTAGLAMRPATKCLADLRAFDSQMRKSGYWLNGSGYGDPMGGVYGAGMPGPVAPMSNMSGYQNARPGYDVRTLIASADILGRDGQQRACEDVLAATRTTYQRYVADMHARKMPMENVAGWRKQQVAAALPVTSKTMSFRSDELIGTDVRSTQQDAALGSVDDIVMSPHDGKIAYLVIARGGIFGIGEKYVALPWADFKISPDASLLVLDATEAAMKGAPQVPNDHFARPGHFRQESQKVDIYWKAQMASIAAAPKTPTTPPKI